MNNAYSKKIKSLIEYLNKCTQAYDEGCPLISDEEWDNQYFQLKHLEEETGLIFNNSPTQSISYEAVNTLEKKEHNHKMLSLDKTKSVEEVISFLKNKETVAMCKMDGLTCSLTYQNGKLISSETRGNGLIGENILHNAKVIPSIPLNIPYNYELVIDGEIICSYDDFQNFDNEYKNPRNFAAGSIRLLDAKECASRKLQFIAWDVLKGMDEIETLNLRLNELSELGFITVPRIILLKEEVSKIEIFTNAIEDIKEWAKKLFYPIDGVVFKFNDIKYGLAQGETSHHFKNAIAYKFYDETYETQLLDIEWTMGRTGVLTPVAIFEPVDIDGSVVERASLHNCSVMNDLFGPLGPHKFQKIEVFKSNMIIPQVKSVQQIDLYKENKLNDPVICPICGGKVEYKSSNDSVTLVCTNPDCDGKLINRLDHFCGKKGLDIKGISKATLEKLIEWGWVEDFCGIFKLNEFKDKWIKKQGFGIKSVEKILNSIDNGKNCELYQFIAALGIPLIGNTASKELVKHFKTWDEFISAVKNNYPFYQLPNFGSEMHNSIITFNYDEACVIANNYMNFKAVEINDKQNLKGKIFVITGKVIYFKNRDELKAKIESLGGKVTSSISKNTNYLINNDMSSTSAKSIQAKQLGIPVLTESDFIETFNIK